MSSPPIDSPLVAVLPDGSGELQDPPVEKSTYSQILKSTALVGGASVVNLCIGILRTKVMAVLLGPAGFGLAGLYLSITTLTQGIAGMGVNSSGVRQIAESVGSGNVSRIGRTATVLRRTSVALGLLGALVLAVSAGPASSLTFGDREHVGAIYLLSVAVFLNLVSAGQVALIQGMRRISDLARMGVLSAVYGILITTPVVYFFRETGIVPSLLAVAAMTLWTSWYYSRKIPIETLPIPLPQIRQEASALLKLGFAFMASSLLTMGSAYFIRIVVLRRIGLEATGLYQAAWTLGGLYVGIILQAMGADFYPRLTAVANDHVECNRLVNEQAQVSLLLAGPGVIATLAFAPFVISLFYAANFGAAVELLRWICLGIAMRVISWPMGFIIMAKGQQRIIILCELSWFVVHLGLAWILVDNFGLNGVGIAFFGSYVFHILLIFAVVRNLSHFRWSADNQRIAVLYLVLIAGVYTGCRLLPPIPAMALGILAAMASGIHTLRAIGALPGIPKLWRYNN